MPTAQEGSYAPQSSGGGPPFRLLQFQTILNGVPTTVDVEGVVMIDADGRVMFKPGDNQETLSAILAELKNIKVALWSLTGNRDTDITLG